MPMGREICTVFAYGDFMNRDDILRTLKTAERSLKERGVLHAALFGSMSRGDHRPESDIDILIEIAQDAPVGIYEYVGIVHLIEDLFPIKVDVSNRNALKSYVRPSVERDAIYAF
jgi:predicted nucleotidyltransferase